MLEFEQISVWERLQAADKPILLYGMGNGADKILTAFAGYGIPCSGVFASDGFVRGHSFHGFPVLSYTEACRRFGDFIVVLAFAVFRKDMLDWLDTLSQRHELYAPDVPVVDSELFTSDYLYNHIEEIQTVYDFLSDEQSKLVYRNVLNFKISGKISWLKACETEQREVYETLFPPRAGETYLDLGAYTGDTIKEWIRFCPNYGRIIAMEPDAKNFKRLISFLATEKLTDVVAYPYAVWSEKTVLSFAGRAGRSSVLSRQGTGRVQAESIDGILAGQSVNYIKMDVEGAEQEALLGGTVTLRRFAPKLNIAAYHRSKDLFALPLLVKKLNPAYEIYLRHHPYIPAWETNLYCKTRDTA